MAKDAKIGSLIGLVLIFIVAFVINGFTRSSDTTEPGSDTANNMSDYDSGDNDLTDWSNGEQRENDLPTDNPGDAGSGVSRTATEPTAREPISNVNSNVPKSDVEKPAMSEVFYSICEGDNLADIAKKFYGPEEGNRRANVLRLFQANRNVLSSPHELFVGQKLVIPPLKTLEQDGSLFSNSLFETVKSIGRKHLSTPNHTVKQSRLYAVIEGDSLWSISTAMLGDGSRYKEISKLNAGLLKHEDRLAVGMRLRIPAQ
ncbi:LysM peptidoglycan-binding domain-containing protein [Planctomycetota bacterium]